MSTHFISKTHTTRSFFDHKVASFIDNSGSTACVVHGASILFFEQSIASCLHQNPTSFKKNNCYWSTNVIMSDIATPAGGTDPSTIFSNHSSKTLFESSEIVVFITDGEISNSEVNKFSGHLKNHLNKALYICVIVNAGLEKLADLNVSVIAPLIIAPNVICLYHDCTSDKTFVVASRGVVSTIYPNPENFTKQTLQHIQINDLSKLKISSQRLPENVMVLSETDTAYKVLSFENSNIGGLNFSKLIDELSLDEWKIIIRHAITNSLLPELRNSISSGRNESLNKLDAELRLKMCTPNIIKKKEIIQKMVTAYMRNDTPTQLQLKVELEAINDEVKLEELALQEFMDQTMNQTRSKWDSVRNIIADVEKSDNVYSLNNFALGSNRAIRATEVNDESVTKNQVMHTGCPEIECVIHMDKGPAVLWFAHHKIANPDIITSDFCLNFPLASFPQLRDLIVPNPVCGFCAKDYLIVCNQSVYRQAIGGFIPINLKIKSNLKYATGMLNMNWCQNKCLPHVTMLLLSLLDDCKANWLTFRDYLINELVHSILTTDTFSEEGLKMNMADALLKVVHNENHLMRQPFGAAMRILRLSHQIQPFDCIPMIRTCFTYGCIEKYCSKVKNISNNISVNDQILKMLYHSKCGFIMQNLNRKITINDMIFRNFFDDSLSMQCLVDTVSYFNLDIEKVIPDTMLANILWHLTTLTHHEKPSTVYKNLSSSYKIFRSIVSDQGIYDYINDKQFGQYHKISENMVLPYAFYLGPASTPSKLWFLDQPLWDASWNESWNAINISDLEKNLAPALQQRMAKYYGSHYPSTNSAHTRLHRIVAKIIDKYIETTITDEMIVACIKAMLQTGGNYGNIYKNYIVHNIIYTIYNFLEIKANAISRGLDKKITHTDSDLSTRSKILAEARTLGMKIEDDIVFFDHKLVHRPIMLEEKYKHLDIENMIERIDKKFFGSNEEIRMADHMSRLLIDDNCSIKN